MTDKERIFLEVIRGLEFTLASLTRCHYEYGVELEDGDVRFEPTMVNGKLNIRKGDLVMGKTGPLHDHTIGWVHEIYDENHLSIREIGTNRLCDYSNEFFVVIRGLYPNRIFDGDEYVFYKKVWKALYKLDEYIHRFYRLDIHDHDAIIWIREKWGSLGKKRSVPYFIHIHWNNKTTIKYIMDEMVKQGFGTREFQYVDKGE